MKSELLAVSVDQDRVRVRRPGELARLPFETGVASGDESPWNNGVRSLTFDGKSAMKLPGLDLTGNEPFSMAAWVYLPKITLHPGQTGGAHALVIASQMTAGRCRGEAGSSANRMGLRNRRRRGTAPVARRRGKSDSRAGAVSQAGQSGHVESPHVHLRRRQNGKRLRLLRERHQVADRAWIIWCAGFDHRARAEGEREEHGADHDRRQRERRERASKARLPTSAFSTASSPRRNRASPRHGRRSRRPSRKIACSSLPPRRTR